MWLLQPLPQRLAYVMRRQRSKLVLRRFSGRWRRLPTQLDHPTLLLIDVRFQSTSVNSLSRSTDYPSAKTVTSGLAGERPVSDGGKLTSQ